MKIERLRTIIAYSDKNREEIYSMVKRFCSFAGIEYDSDLLNILQIVRSSFQKKGYFVFEMPFADDGIITDDLIIERNNSDLANILGNLVNRTISMSYKYFDGIVENKNVKTDVDKDLIEKLSALPLNFKNKMDELRIADAIDEVFNCLRASNKYIDETTPWVLAKEGRTEELASVMNHLANAIFIAGMLLKPVLVKASDNLFAQLGLPEDLIKYDNVYKFGCIQNVKVNKGDQLFPRLDASIEVPFIQEMMVGK